MQSAWILTEGLMGMKNQGLGLAEALGMQAIEKKVQQRFPWTYCSPYFRCFKRFSHKEHFCPPWPDVIISCGRQAIVPSLHLKEISKKPLLYIQDPRIASHHFDIVICPTHDAIEGPNVIKVLGTIHRITPDVLHRPRIFESYKRPHHVVLIGGPHKDFDFDVDYLVSSLKKVCDGTLLITPSRRTPLPILSLLQSIEGSYLWDQKGDNPYFDLLATADTITVTNESVNMISEACATWAPVYLFPFKQVRRSKFSLFHEELLKIKRIRFFDPKLDRFPVEPLKTREFLVQALKGKLGKPF